MAETTREENIQKLGDLIKDIDVAMLTTVDTDGSLRSRPMMTQHVKFDGNLWFFIHDDAPIVPEIRHEREVNVSYADPSNDLFVSVTGTATMVKDRTKMETLWHPVYETWFPDGLDDPGLALLKVEVDRAQYWKPKSDSKLMEFIDLTKATGERHETINGKVNLNP